MAADRYESGPAAPVRATARAWERIGSAAVLVLVEGISDQIAVEAAAAGLGTDLEAERAVVVPIGGAHAIGGFLERLGAGSARVRLAALCDRLEEPLMRRAAAAVGVRMALHVCDRDLEDELIRSVGAEAAGRLFAAHGDLGAFRSLQGQPAWRGRPVEEQMRRFLGSGAGRKLRYASLLVEEALRRDALPAPLAAVAGPAGWSRPG